MKPLPIKQTLASLAVVCLCVLTIVWLVGFIAGVYASTGMLPIPNSSTDIACPDVTKPSLLDVHNTLSEVDFPEYGVGYNCVDFAWQASRALAWQGQPSAIVGVAFDTGPNHALLYVPTTDEGWVFIEMTAQKPIIVRPTVGGMYNGRRITSMKVLVIHWVPIDEFSASPIFEVIENE